MKRMSNTWCALMAGLSLVALASQAGEFRFPVGLAYNSGMQDVVDKVKENYATSDDYVVPVSLTLEPYYEFDNGLGIGASVGPMGFLVIENLPGGDNVNYLIPVGGYVRYSLFRDKAVSPYIRGGFRYTIASGDFVSTGDIGAMGAVGVEFFRNRAIGMALEVGYDTGTVKIHPGPLGGEKSANFSGLIISVSAVF